MAKKGKITWEGFFVDCPYCGGPVPDPITGSHVFSISHKVHRTDVLKCEDCGKVVELPEKIWRM